MKYFVDCEFDGRGGPLMSMALVSETGKSMYVVMNYRATDPWVLKNVHTVMLKFPINEPYPCVMGADAAQLSEALTEFLKADTHPYFISDNEQDIMYLCDALVGPVYVPDKTEVDLAFRVHRVDPYPTTLKGAVQHNAWWDAMALRHRMGIESAETFQAIRASIYDGGQS